MAYDEECERLAEHFLHGTTRRASVVDLAQAIQNAVEDWFLSQPETNAGAVDGEQ